MAPTTTKKKGRETFVEWLESLPEREEALRTFDQLLGLLRTNDRSNLSWWRQVGTRILRLRGFIGRHYGRQFMRKLSEAVPWTYFGETKVLMFYHARELADRFNASEVRSLPAAITFRHVVSLLSINDRNKKTWQEFVDLCVKHRLSGVQLDREIQNDRGGRRGGGGGRFLPRKTTSPVMALQDLQLVARRWRLFHEESFRGEGALFRQARKREDDEFLAEKVKLALSALAEIRDAVAKEQELLRKLASELGVRLARAVAAVEKKGVRGPTRKRRKD